MSSPLMPKATAIWLLENTALTFEQISEFCGLHILEVEAMANDESGLGMLGANPLTAGQLTQDEIDLCTVDPMRKLSLHQVVAPQAKGKYTPLVRRQEKPGAILWLLRQHPGLSDAQIIRLIGTTKTTIESLRKRTHWNMQNIQAHSPVDLNLCTTTELSSELSRCVRQKDSPQGLHLSESESAHKGYY